MTNGLKLREHWIAVLQGVAWKSKITIVRKGEKRPKNNTTKEPTITTIPPKLGRGKEETQMHNSTKRRKTGRDRSVKTAIHMQSS